MRTSEKIIHITYQTKVIGGVERFIECLLGCSNKKETILKLYDCKNNTTISNRIDCLNESNTSYNPLFLMYFTIKRAYLYKKYCQKNNIDISFSHGDSLNLSNLISKYLFKNKSKIIIFLHNSLSFYDNTGSRFYKYLFAYFYPKANKVVTISAEMKHELEKSGYINTHLLYNPLDLKHIKRLENEKINKYKDLFVNNKYTFITVGRLEKVKNISFLINSFKDYSSKEGDSQFIIIGDGSISGDLQKLVKGNDDIHFIPFQENIYKYLMAADAFIFSSLNEGFGRVLIESLATGTPVLSHDFKYGAREIVRNSNNWEKCKEVELHKNGVLTPYLDKVSFIKGMEIIRKSRFDKKEIQNNIKKYSIENSILSYNEIIHEISS